MIELCFEYLSVRCIWLSCHVTYAFQSQFKFCNCLNVKELLAQSRSKIGRLSDCNSRKFRTCFEQLVPWYAGNYRVWIHSETGRWYEKNIQSNGPCRQVFGTQLNHLAGLAKWLSVRLRTKWFWVRIQLKSLNLQISWPALSKEFLDIETNIHCGFTLKRVRVMTRTYSQMHCADKFSEHSWITRPLWPNGWVFV